MTAGGLWSRLRRRWLTTEVVLRLVPIGVVIACGVVATTWTHILLSDHQDLVVHTYQAIDTTKDVLIALDDAETGQRGYLLSDDRRFLDWYDKALARLPAMRQKLRTQVTDNAAQIARVEQLGGLIDTKLGELREAIRTHDDKGSEAARALEVAAMERATMDRIRHMIGDITETEKALLAARQTEVDKDEDRIRIVAILIGLASFVTRTVVELHIARRRSEAGGATGADA